MEKITLAETKHKELLQELSDSSELQQAQFLLHRYGDGTKNPKELISMAESISSQNDSQSQETPQISSLAANEINAIYEASYPYPPIAQKHIGFFHRLFNYVLGAGPENQYALICFYCGSHNGLCPQKSLDLVRYFCPYCKAYNCKTGIPPPKLPHTPLYPHTTNQTPTPQNSQNQTPTPQNSQNITSSTTTTLLNKQLEDSSMENPTSCSLESIELKSHTLDLDSTTSQKVDPATTNNTQDKETLPKLIRSNVNRKIHTNQQ